MPSKVAITRVAAGNVQAAVDSALDLVGAAGLMKPGMTVLLKPNMLTAKPPERAVTTHPEVLRAAIRWVKRFTPARVVVADSAGGTARGTTEKVFKESTLEQVCIEEGVEPTPFEKTERKVYTIENPLVLDEFASSSLLAEADIIINLPKIKTHGLTKLTCAIKNMFGTVLLGNKPMMHARFPSINDFSKALADVYSASKPAITIVDGVLCQEGNGPSAGDVVALDIVLASLDGVAADTVACNIIGLDPAKVLHLVHAAAKGLGTMRMDEIEIAGEPLDAVKRTFKIPPGSPLAGAPIPRFIADKLGARVFKAKVIIDPARCKTCGTCWKNCPVEAITKPTVMEPGNIPSWDAGKCITCYCCAETCPHEAIEFAIHPIRNLIFSPWGAAGVIGLVALILIAWYLFMLLG